MKIYEEYNSCTLCPRKCAINRNNGEKGFCGATNQIKYALANLHMFEEPCISGKNGSGTIFFIGCNLKCIFCQNYKISQESNKYYDNEKLESAIHTVDELVNDMLRLQIEGANNINIVTGFMYVPQIIDAIKMARKKGLKVPIVYNSSGYENVQTVELLKGVVDIYLPDIKYISSELSMKLSGAKDYFQNASSSVKEMYNQVGSPVISDDGIMKKGLMIRHLILPDHINNSLEILDWINNNFGNKVYVSIMAQYFPTYKLDLLNDNRIGRKITSEELQIVENKVFELNFEGFIQDIESDEEQYVPKF